MKQMNSLERKITTKRVLIFFIRRPPSKNLFDKIMAAVIFTLLLQMVYEFMVLKNLWHKNGFAIEVPICNVSFRVIYSSRQKEHWEQ